MISIVIPWRRGNQNDRNDIADWCFKRYTHLFPNAEIIICDSEDGIFSRGKSINIGVKNCSGDYVVITDADYLFSEGMVKEIINKQSWTVGVKSENYSFLLKEASEKLIQNTPNVDISLLGDVGRFTQKNIWHVYGGLLAMPKENFMKVKFDPNFLGYGWEDEAFYFAMRSHFGKEFRTNQKMYHIFHERIAASDYMKNSTYNKEYYDRVYAPLKLQGKLMKDYVACYNKTTEVEV